MKSLCFQTQNESPCPERAVSFACRLERYRINPRWRIHLFSVHLIMSSTSLNRMVCIHTRDPPVLVCYVLDTCELEWTHTMHDA
jgi:hypothetical protein